MRPGVEVLRELPLFGSCDADLLGRLNELADLARLGPDEDVLNEGARAGDLSILLAGHVAIMRSQPAGGEATVDIVAPVTAIGFASVFLGASAPVAARTVTPARFIFVPGSAVKAMIAAEPRLALPFLDHALGELNRLTEEVCQLKLLSSAQRLGTYLLGLIDAPEQTPARLVLPYEKRFLAGKIGCSQANLSRAFAALRGVGVQTRQGGVIIRDTAALRAFAESRETAER